MANDAGAQLFQPTIQAFLVLTNSAKSLEVLRNVDDISAAFDLFTAMFFAGIPIGVSFRF